VPESIAYSAATRVTPKTLITAQSRSNQMQPNTHTHTHTHTHIYIHTSDEMECHRWYTRRWAIRSYFSPVRRQKHSDVSAGTLAAPKRVRSEFSDWHHKLRNVRVVWGPLKRGLTRACCIYYSINDANIIRWLRTVMVDCVLQHLLQKLPNAVKIIIPKLRRPCLRQIL
jgi:hypothetical protein